MANGPSAPAPQTSAQTCPLSASCGRFRRSAAIEAEPERSAAIPISNHRKREASAISSSLTRTMSSTVRRTVSKMRSSVRRQLMVGTIDVTSSSVTTWP